MSMQENNSPTEKTKSKFVYVQKDNDDKTCIKITEGKYKDIIYHYGNVQFAKEEKADGTLPMIFDYIVDRNPHDADTLDNQEFIDYIGDILIEIMEQQIKDGTIIEQNRNDNPQ